MSKVLVLVIVVLVLAAAGYYFMKGSQSMYAPTQQQGSTTAATATPAGDQPTKINEQNSSGQYGIVELKEKDGKVVVILSMAGGAPGVPQPAHIHMGKCPKVGEVAYSLTDVVDGKSETTLDVTLAQLAAKLPLGLNVHKSEPEASMYVACGNLTFPGVTPEAAEK